ncbi:MAG TPA: hypothetical protein VFG47_09620 [Geminicoccaceae bacterium]|nr:hypothetical protein [Geminicoccaceae bacterium]
MKPLVVSALALGALSAAAFAEEPITLTDAQMDVVTAGKKGVSVSQKSFADLTIGLDGSDKGSASVSLSVELTDSIDTEVTEQGVIVKIGKRLDSDLPPGGSASLWSEVKVTAQPGQTVRMVKSKPGSPDGSV